VTAAQRKALVIDDDSDIVEILRLLLEMRGFTVDTVSDGIDALELREAYDAILLDLNMPVFDGERLADYWLLTRPEVLQRVIVLSGYSRFTRGRDIPAFAMVLTPFDPQELLRVVEACAQQTLGILIAAVALTAAAQEKPAAESPLDALLATPISTAAKYDQRMSEVPASVTVVTSEEIARYGWRTLADVLASVRGVYTTYDRSSTCLGVRGVGLPTDSNNRFLVLIDGHPMLEAVSASALIGTTMAIDLSMFSRIEFVRGPSSVLYGTGAMFGVINLITKDEDERSTVIGGAGSNGMEFGSARGGFRLGSVSASVGVSWQQSSGADLYFKEFDSPDTNNGVVRDHDFDNYRSILATLAWRELRVVALQSTRTKGVPTASWATTFGGDEHTTNGRTLVGIQFAHNLAPGSQISVRSNVDRFRFSGDYPYGDDLWSDELVSTRTSAEMQYVRDVRANRLTVGARGNRTSRASYIWGNASEATSVNAPFTIATLYAQDEWEPLAGLTITAGASVDHYSGNGNHVTPRAAVIYAPSEHTTVKVLIGDGFRLPNVYETFFTGSTDAPLRPESIRTRELVWEGRVTSDILLTASAFDVRVDDVLQHVPAGSDDSFINGGGVRSHGVELQGDYRRSDGIWTYASYSFQHAVSDDGPMPNSPRHLVKAGVSTPTSGPPQGALELLYGSGRDTLKGARTGSALLANMNVTVALTRVLSAGVTVRNLFGTNYSLPGGPEHVQDAIPQDGRTFMFRLLVKGR
jgi:outer membrane receptor protein involved in Fe transport